MDLLRSLPWRTRTPLPIVGRGETLIMESRHHWMKRLPYLCIYAVLMGAGYAALFLLPPGSADVSIYILLSVLAAMVAVQHWFFHIMLSESATDIVLTNKRVLYFYHRIWIADEMDELVMQKIKLVKAHRNGIIRQIFNYGDLSCLFDIDAGKTFQYVPSPGAWARKIEPMINIS